MVGLLDGTWKTCIDLCVYHQPWVLPSTHMSCTHLREVLMNWFWCSFSSLPISVIIYVTCSNVASIWNSLLQAHQINTLNGEQDCSHIYSYRKLATHRTQISSIYPQRMPVMTRQTFEEAPPGGIWRPKHWWHSQPLQCHLLLHEDGVMDNLTLEWGDSLTPAVSGQELTSLSPVHQPRDVLTSSYLCRAKLSMFIKRWAVVHVEVGASARKPLHLGFSNEIPQILQNLFFFFPSKYSTQSLCIWNLYLIKKVWYVFLCRCCFYTLLLRLATWGWD